MTDAQTWTALGFLVSAQLGLLTYAYRMVEFKFAAVDRLDTKFDRLEDRIDKRFERLELRIDGLDRDVAALVRGRLGGQ